MIFAEIYMLLGRIHIRVFRNIAFFRCLLYYELFKVGVLLYKGVRKEYFRNS